jgi:hypothetical protein
MKGTKFNPIAWFRQRNEIDPEDEDQTPVEDRIPALWWTTGLAASTVMSVAILATKFNMNVGEAILALILGFIFSFMAVQSSGHTDVNPVSTVAKVSIDFCFFYRRLTHLKGFSTHFWRHRKRLRRPNQLREDAELGGWCRRWWLCRPVLRHDWRLEDGLPPSR